MSLSLEAQFVLVALALYVHDSVLLLHPDEVIFWPDLRGRWHLGFSSDSARLGRRQLYLPSLWAVHRPIFRARWGYETPLAGSSPGWDRLCRFHRGLSFLVAGAAASVFLLLPAALILRLPDRFLLAVIALAYVFVLASLIRVWVMREHCPLSRGKLLAVTFECLICPPIAANLLRRLSLAVKVDQDAAAAAAQLLGQQAWDTARDAFVTRLRQQMELEEPGSARYEQLAARGGKLVLAESA